MDRSGNYNTSDTLFKIAMDFQMQNPVGSGFYGTYHSNYDKSQLKHVRNKLGIPTQKNIGIKEFHDNTTFSEMIQEIISAVLFPKIINKYTDMNAVEISIPSLTWAIRNKSMISPKVSGVSWEEEISKLNVNLNLTKFQNMTFNEIEYKIDIILYNMIKNEMDKAKILWADIHPGNYFMDESYVSDFIIELETEIINNVPEQNPEGENGNNWGQAVQIAGPIAKRIGNWMNNTEVTKHITIIDFGKMRVAPSGPARKEIDDFLMKLEPYVGSNNLITEIWTSIRNMQ